jgi:hypothetical protein
MAEHNTIEMIKKKVINQIKEDYIKKNDYKDWFFILGQSNFGLKYILENKHLNWNWKILSKHPELPIEFVIENDSFDWDWEYLILRKDTILKPIKKWQITEKQFKILNENNDLNLRFQPIQDNPHLSWNYELIQRKCKDEITKEFIMTNKDKKWNFKELSKRKDIPTDFILNNISLDWDFEELSEREDIPMNFIEKYSHFNWNLYKLSERKDFPLHFIQGNKKEYLNWNSLSKRIDIPIEFIIENYLFGWDLEYLFVTRKFPKNFYKYIDVLQQIVFLDKNKNEFKYTHVVKSLKKERLCYPPKYIIGANYPIPSKKEIKNYNKFIKDNQIISIKIIDSSNFTSTHNYITDLYNVIENIVIGNVVMYESVLSRTKGIVITEELEPKETDPNDILTVFIRENPNICEKFTEIVRKFLYRPDGMYFKKLENDFNINKNNLQSII